MYIPKESPLYYTSDLVLGIGQARETVDALESDIYRSDDKSWQIATIYSREIDTYSKMAVDYMQLGSAGFHCACAIWKEWDKFKNEHRLGSGALVAEVSDEKALVIAMFFSKFYQLLLDNVVAPIVDTQARLTQELAENDTDQDLIARLSFFDKLNTQLIRIVKNAMSTFIDGSSQWTSPQAHIKKEVITLLTDASNNPAVTKVRSLLGYSLKTAATFAFGFIAIGVAPPEMLRGSKYTRSEKAVLKALSSASYYLLPVRKNQAQKSRDFSLSIEDDAAASSSAAPEPTLASSHNPFSSP